MLFNSSEFILLFLPVALIGYYSIGYLRGPIAGVTWLVLMSSVFYSYWNVAFVPILAVSLLANYALGRAISHKPNRWLLALGVGANILLLGWFKYANFLVDNIDWAFSTGIDLPAIALPLAISFYTFQQIAYLVDTYDGEEAETNFLRYSCFVLFFPHLIAGPVVLYKDVRRQLTSPETYRFNSTHMVFGLTIFAVGLFKKTCLADPIGPIADALFRDAAAGIVPSFGEAWFGTLAYTVQLYFDFSGYSDMAVGLGLMFNIRLPINFWSPYKSGSIIEFWSRWHMTLTRFLTTYVYNPILMSLTRRRMRQGKPLLRRSSFALVPFIMLLVVPTSLTMLISGIWHGAGWQFVIWGLLHGLMLIINHAWRAFRHAYGIGPAVGRVFRPLGVLLTFTCVALALVFFRAGSVAQALIVFQGLTDVTAPIYLPRSTWLERPDMLLVLIGLAIVWLLPNALEWIGGFESDGAEASVTAKSAQGVWFSVWRPSRWQWRPNFRNGIVMGALICFALIRVFGVVPSQFLYFTF
ncbi:MBOAT family O-acyltransferase [Microvirga arabica]|uniref:Probable alginate O-acetylase AlgI n=1 Tax=Microvirga arabica TaxID=1128671 RepID=A0ABV6YDK1_9HYPH